MTPESPRSAGEKGAGTARRILRLRREAPRRASAGPPADTLPRLSGASAPSGGLAAPAFARPGGGTLAARPLGDAGLPERLAPAALPERGPLAQAREASEALSAALRRQRRRVPQPESFGEELT